MAEWSKALDLGSSLHWHGFKSHRPHLLFVRYSYSRGVSYVDSQGKRNTRPAQSHHSPRGISLRNITAPILSACRLGRSVCAVNANKMHERTNEECRVDEDEVIKRHTHYPIPIHSQFTVDPSCHLGLGECLLDMIKQWMQHLPRPSYPIAFSKQGRQ